MGCCYDDRRDFGRRGFMGSFELSVLISYSKTLYGCLHGVKDVLFCGELHVPLELLDATPLLQAGVTRKCSRAIVCRTLLIGKPPMIDPCHHRSA